MKVKIITLNMNKFKNDPYIIHQEISLSLENEINKFIKNKKIIDIKMYGYKGFSALVLYT